jgi:polyisoprenoid-binding protein YceI
MRCITAAPVWLALIVAVPVSAQLPTMYPIDPGHSSVAFKVPFMGFGSVRGEFQEFAGILLLGETPEKSAVGAVIRTHSISTHGKVRDNHLRSPDFFAADSFPVITFYSIRIERTRAGLVAHGPLTMRGVTRLVALPFTNVHAPAKDAWGNMRVTYRGAIKLSRRDFNIRGTAFWNSEFDPGRFAVGDSVEVELEISATVPNTARWSIPKTDSLVQVAETSGVDAIIANMSATRDTTGRPNDNAIFVTGYKLAQRGRTEAALKLFRWALDYFNTSTLIPYAANVLAEIELKNGERAAAIRSFRKALKADPTDPASQTWLRYLGEPAT